MEYKPEGSYEARAYTENGDLVWRGYCPSKRQSRAIINNMKRLKYPKIEWADPKGEVILRLEKIIDKWGCTIYLPLRG